LNGIFAAVKTNLKQMKKNVTVFGLLSGLSISVFMLIATTIFCGRGDYDNSELVGYAGMLAAFTFIFVGIKNYRDKYNNRFISFGQAFRIGLYITLISSTMYVITWLIVYYNFMPDFMDKFADHTINELKEKGASAAEIQEQTAQMNSYKEMYKNPLFVILLTYAEIVPVGLIVSLICAFILKRKDKNDQAVGIA
jgi:hypothetical protein